MIQSMENVWNMEWKKNFSMEWNGMEDFDGYGIWKISIPFHSIACPAENLLIKCLSLVSFVSKIVLEFEKIKKKKAKII